MFHESLPRSIRIFVPYHERAIRDKLELDLAREAGGWTSTQATGAWVSDLTGALLKDITVVYEAFYKHEQAAGVQDVTYRAVAALLNSTQESVLIEWDGKRELYRQ